MTKKSKAGDPGATDAKAALKIPRKAATYFRMARPFIEMGAEVLADADENETGNDDLAAELLRYTSSAVGAVLDGKAIPPVPDVLIQAGARPPRPVK